MILTTEAIKDFQEAYKRDFGEEISAEEAEAMGQRLISLFSVIYKPIPKSELTDLPPTEAINACNQNKPIL